MKNPKYFFLVLGLVLLAISAANFATTTPALLSGALKDWTANLERIERVTQKSDVDDDVLEELRQELHNLHTRVLAAIEEAAPEIQRVTDEYNALGSPPSADAPKELPEITAKRKAISDELAAIDGATKGANLFITRIDDVLQEISLIKRNRFAERIFSRSQPPLSPSLWKKVGAECLTDWNQFSVNLQNFIASPVLQTADTSKMAMMFTGGALLFVLLSFWLRHWIVARARSLRGEPSQGQRLEFALTTGLIHALAPSSVVFSFYLVLQSSGIMPNPIQELTRICLTALLSIFLITAFCRSVLTPYSPRWRLVGSSAQGSRSISLVIIAVAVVFALDRVFDALRILFAASLEFTILQKFIYGLGITAILLIFLNQPFWRKTDTPPARPSIMGTQIWNWIRLFLFLLIPAIPLSAAFGYVALSYLLATQIVLTLGLLLGSALARGVIAEIIRHLLAPEKGDGVAGQVAIRDDNEMQIFWVNAFANFIIIVVAFFALLLVWGAGIHDFSAWLYRAFFGFKVGSLTISLSDILIAAGLFLLLIAFTRYLQKTLEHNVFPKTRLDIGIRNSLRAGIGYVGFVMALLLAASAVGLNLSSLAMIAGALSVGIGFGMQNIISNFVSGLILLVERPIKVGDLVAVGEYQGYVRKISVRATELTTFDQASVFIPNSQLIASSVLNKTHSDRYGRIIIPLGIEYGSDTEKVKKLLLEIVQQHPEIMRKPAPRVLFRAFGSDALQFELFAYIFEVDNVLSITSDLCFMIDKVLRENGITLPVPQHAVNLTLQSKQLDALLKALSAHQN